jgi:hypothetical protein
LQPVNPWQLARVAREYPPLLSDPDIHRGDPLPQFGLNRGVSDAPTGALQSHFDYRSLGACGGLNRVKLLGSIDRQARQLGLAQRFVQFPLRLVFFPQARRSDPAKPRFLLVLLCFPALLILSGNKSTEASFQRRLREMATNRARFDTYERAPVSKNKAVCAQSKPHAVSVGNPVKFLPRCRVNESLGVPLKPDLERFLAGLRHDIVPAGFTPLMIILGKPELVLENSAQFRPRL